MDEEVVNQEEKPMELSACYAEGLCSPKTLKLTGKIGERSVVVLIDSDASHNYISRRIMEELGLPVTGTSSYPVSMGDGHK